jgi:hypothetical protein
MEVLVPHARKPSKYEKFPRLRVSFPRTHGQYEYLHRIAAYAFPPQGPGSRHRFGDYDAFSRAKYQADHLVDALLVARPSMAIAGWLDPILPAEHLQREKLRREMREARGRADEVLRRLDRGPVALRALEDKAQQLTDSLATSRRPSQKRQQELRTTKRRAKRMKTAIAECERVEQDAFPTSWDIQKPGDLILCSPEDPNEYEDSLLIEFDRALGFTPYDRKRAALFAWCRKRDVLKVRVSFD